MEFLHHLGARFRQPARLYLVGGTTMVFEALRLQTLDIDVVLEVSADAHGALIQAIRELKDSILSTYIETTNCTLPPSGQFCRHNH
jgi:hypothetical protein